MYRILTAALLSFVGALAIAQQPALTLNDMKSWQIVSAPAAIESEKYAAAEFQRIFQEITGTSLPLAASRNPGQPAVFIGLSPVPLPNNLGEEGLRIIVGNDTIYIDGGRPRGTLYGVYEFFEELCGVRFLTLDHTYYPPDAVSRPLPAGERSYTPPFSFRWSYYGETNRQPDFAARLRVNTIGDDAKFGGRTGYRLVGHNVANLVPPAQYGADHPEYYALVDGQRKLEMKGGGPQLCMSNPALVDIIVNALEKEIAANPGAKNVNIAQMDNEHYCTCPDCAAIDAREESHAGAILTLVNKVADRLAKSHPDVLIGTYAYQYTRKPPKTLRANPNVLIQLCSIECCDFHSIDDPSCPLNRQFCRDMATWKTKADHIFIWHYNTNFRGYQLPFPNFRSIGHSVDYFFHNNGQGVFMQAAGNGFSSELSDLRNYVMARCLWKPGRDSWAEMEEFCRLHYAEAAEPIIAYLTDYHARVDKMNLHPNCFPTEAALAITPDYAQKILGYFNAALALATSDDVRKRVEKASICAYRAALSSVEMNLVYSDGTAKPDLSGFDPAVLQRYEELCAAYSVAMEDENTSNADYLAELHKLHGGIKAAKAENDSWRVVVLPEFNAKLVELTYKPANRNVAFANRGFKRFHSEEWVIQGEGPSSQNTVVFDAVEEPNKATLTHTTADGSRFTRTITLNGDAVQFGMTLTAGVDRPADFHIHTEYDTATYSDDQTDVGIYVKNPQWTQANAQWTRSVFTDAQADIVKQAAPGGAYAYFTREAGFGVEERFDPNQFHALIPYWQPSRRQLNLELLPKIVNLKKGESASYQYEIHYLSKPPTQ